MHQIRATEGGQLEHPGAIPGFYPTRCGSKVAPRIGPVATGAEGWRSRFGRWEFYYWGVGFKRVDAEGKTRVMPLLQLRAPALW